MKLILRFAYKNVVESGLKTWLNVGVLSFVFVVIIFYRGFINGWQQQSINSAIAWEYGDGQLRNSDWDESDPFSIKDGHGKLPEALLENSAKNLTPVLLRQGSVYPQGRMMSITLRGIPEDQKAVNIPTGMMKMSDADIPVVIGNRMASSLKVKKGDELLLRWRDDSGTFDAANVTIAGIFDTQIATVDNGQLWLPLEKLRFMTALEGEATYFIANNGYKPKSVSGWEFHSQKELLSDFQSMVEAESIGGAVMYLLLLAIALLAIFDTQVLSIFRRQKEIGTFISLGMTRRQVAGMFTLEGMLYSLLGTVAGVIWGLPIFWYFGSHGIGMANMAEGTGINMANVIYPLFDVPLIITTLLLIIGTATLVSFLPSRRIAKMDPVRALKGRAI